MAKKKHTKPKKQRRAIDELSESVAEESDAGSWIAWEAPEFQYYEKGWLWATGLVAGALVFLVVFYLMRDYSAMAVVVLAAVVLYQQSRLKPRMIKYRVDESGLHLGDDYLPWNQLKSFWLSGGSEHNPHLYLETLGRWSPVKTVHLANVDPVELRARLADHLPEHLTRGEALTDLVIRWLKL